MGGCAVALYQCAATAATCGGSALDIANAAAVRAFWTTQGCWKKERVAGVPYPCGTRWCKVLGVRTPCGVQMCTWHTTEKIFYPTTPAAAAYQPNNRACKAGSWVGKQKPCHKTSQPCCRCDHRGCQTWGHHTAWCYVEQGTCDEGSTYPGNGGAWSEVPCQR